MMAKAADFLPDRNTALELIAAKDAVVAGQDIEVMVKVNVRDGWHVYWRNPGDSGEGIHLKWALPEGFSAGDINWPTPERLPYDTLVNFGYKKEVGFIVPITAPDTVSDKAVTLNVHAEILVCQEICIPENQDLSLTLPVAASNMPANEIAFTAVKNTLPFGTDDDASFYETKNGDFVLQLPATNVFEPVSVFPEEWGLIDNAAQQKIENTKDGTKITIPRGTRPLEELNKTQTFVLRDASGMGLAIWGHKNEAPPASDAGWPTAILFAFIGGLILNLMPCVFPILSIKALSLVKLSSEERMHSQNLALTYTAGILTCFLGFAGILILLRQAGHSIGWGFQLQSPELVTILAWLIVLVGFNLLGFFDIRGIGGVGEKLTRAKGLTGSYFTGVLAALVATPCTAPFMAPALGVALLQPAPIALCIFMALGMGLAFPFLLISFVPALAKSLPKPGIWMENFRQFLAFPMFAGALWLIWVAANQTGESGLLYILGGIIVIGFMIWLANKKSFLARSLLALSGLLLFVLLIMLPPRVVASNASDTHVFSQQKIDEAVAQNRIVFVNMTAKWCVTCMVNDKVAISVPQTIKRFTDKNVLYLKGDWTFQDDAITKYLAAHGRSGVPLYVVYKDGKEIILPQLLTPAIVAQSIE